MTGGFVMALSGLSTLASIAFSLTDVRSDDKGEEVKGELRNWDKIKAAGKASILSRIMANFVFVAPSETLHASSGFVARIFPVASLMDPVFSKIEKKNERCCHEGENKGVHDEHRECTGI